MGRHAALPLVHSSDINAIPFTSIHSPKSYKESSLQKLNLYIVKSTAMEFDTALETNLFPLGKAEYEISSYMFVPAKVLL